MNCPNCGTPYAAGSHFCGTCGAPLPAVPAAPVPPPAYAAPVPKNPAAGSATLGGLAGLIGGSLVVIGWLLPWFGVGTFGIGSGFQLAFVTMLGAVLGGQSRYTGGLVIVAVLLFILLITIPILGVLNLLGGNAAVGKRSAASQQDIESLNALLGQMRSRSIAGLILMVLIFAVVSLIPFGSSVLATGFYLTGIAFGVTFLGNLFAKA